jgi:hypothetical protein
MRWQGVLAARALTASQTDGMEVVRDWESPTSLELSYRGGRQH